MMNPRIVTFLLAIGALAVWRLALYRKRHDDTIGVSTGSSRLQLSQLLLASFLTIFLELAVIRWIAVEVRIFAYIKNLAVDLLSGIRTGMRARPRQSKVVDRSKCIAGPADNRPLALARWPRAGRSFSSPGRSVRRRNMGCRQIMELGPLHTGGGGCELIALPDHLYFRSAGTNSQPPNLGR